MLKNLEDLIKTIRDRKNSSSDKSYTNKLLNDKNLSVSKVKEEVAELIEAVEKNTNKIHESADVIYHLLVYLEANNIKIEDVMKELEKRKNNALR
jgi:phosphoribosyl-ATP pyrophosphohydrolase|tara:strand:+ start:71 stop:355 length:285 start_codon:yes stop_codon:yes gene_type:complete